MDAKSSNARIFGAEEALDHEFPWQILLYINYDGKKANGQVKRIMKKCGGALISDHHILTAARCFYDDDNK